VAASWSVAGGRTTIVRLLVRNVEAGARVELRCLGRRCPFSRERAGRPRRGTVNALAALGADTVLRAGQTLEVRITRTGSIGKVVRYRMRARRRPASSTLCLPLGATRPQSRC
jgi:hypothetical protein